MKRNIHFKLLTKFLFGVFVSLTFISCEKDDDINFEPALFLETEAQTVSNAGGEYSIEALSNMPWEVSADVDWINFAESSGEKGKFWVNYSVIENEDDERTAVITVSAGDAITHEIMVTQEAGNRDDIYVTPDGTGDGFSWENSTNLDVALTMAVTGNTIHIAEGTYSPSLTVTGGDNADEGDKTFEIRNNISLIGGYPANAQEGAESDPSAYSTILDGLGTSYHVVTVAAPMAEAQKVVLKGLTITGGSASPTSTYADINGINFRRDYGGGISIGNAVVEIFDSKIIENSSGKFVAGLYGFGGSEITLRNTQVLNNVSDGNGSGIWVNASNIYIFDSEIIGNEAGGTAAGVHAYPDAGLYMYNSIVANNKGRSFGPGVYFRQNSKGAIVNSVIYGNSSTGQHAGGVMMYNNNELVIVSSTITNNKAKGSGGGVMKQSKNNDLKVYNSIISGNEQASGGDVGENDNGPSPSFYASVIGDKVYDINQMEMTDVNFAPTTMLSQIGESIYLPVGEDNPSLEHGMTVEQLVQLANSMDPALDSELITVDKLHNSREGLNIMGAFVEGE